MRNTSSARRLWRRVILTLVPLLAAWQSAGGLIRISARVPSWAWQLGRSSEAGGSWRVSSLRDDAANCRRIEILRCGTRLICSVKSAYAGILRDRQTQYANGRELPRNWYESFSQLAFHIPAWLGTSRSCLFHKSGRNDQFSLALLAHVAAHTQVGNAPDANRPRKNLRGQRAVGAGLLGRESLVARCMGAPALFPKAMRAAPCDRVWCDDLFWQRIFAV